MAINNFPRWALLCLKKVTNFNGKSSLSTSSRFSSQLSKLVKSEKRDEPINFDTLGTWDNRIELPLLLQASIKHGKPIPKISIDNIGIASVLGRRNTNEDRYRIKELQTDLLYFGIFDGHGGAECAEFCSQIMEEHILYWLARNETDLQMILQTSFQEVNNAYARHTVFNSQNKEDRTVSGTTATVCLLRNSVELVVGHVGDSRALLCRNGEIRKLTTDHIADLKAEKDRIVKSGGNVCTDSLGRSLVNGRLAMTRSLGDLELKPYGVTAQPDTRSLEINHSRDAFVILTTDGINFVMNDQEIGDAVNICHDPTEAASFLTDQALQFASDDNCTAIIVPFGAWGKFRSHKKVTYNQFGRSLHRSTRY